VTLIIQPDNGLAPLLQAIKRAKKRIDIVIFRFDRWEIEKALEAAVARGVVVRALIAHTNRGGEKILRKLELRLLEVGVTVSRTADDLPRYHGKMMIVDDRLYVLGFNYTKLDVEQSRSFGIVASEPKLVKEASALFEADVTRQPYSTSHDRLLVSPENSRERLTAFIRDAKKELLIYDEKLTDKLILRLLQQKANAGVSIRVIGKGPKSELIQVARLAGLRLHVRAVIRDGTAAFVGSQSLRKLELDGRREVGVIVTDSRIAGRIRAVFEADWALSNKNGKDQAPPTTTDEDAEKKPAISAAVAG
jgi:cardiolipin synthase